MHVGDLEHAGPVVDDLDDGAATAGREAKPVRRDGEVRLRVDVGVDQLVDVHGVPGGGQNPLVAPGRHAFPETQGDGLAAGATAPTGLARDPRERAVRPHREDLETANVGDHEVLALANDLLGADGRVVQHPAGHVAERIVRDSCAAACDVDVTVDDDHVLGRAGGGRRCLAADNERGRLVGEIDDLESAGAVGDICRAAIDGDGECVVEAFDERSRQFRLLRIVEAVDADPGRVRGDVEPIADDGHLLEEHIRLGNGAERRERQRLVVEVHDGQSAHPEVRVDVAVRARDRVLHVEPGEPIDVRLRAVDGQRFEIDDHDVEVGADQGVVIADLLDADEMIVVRALRVVASDVAEPDRRLRCRRDHGQQDHRGENERAGPSHVLLLRCTPGVAATATS